MKRLPTSPLESSKAKETLRMSRSGESDHTVQEELPDDPSKTPVSKDTGSSLLSKMGEELTLEKLFSLRNFSFYTQLEERVKTLEQLVSDKDKEIVSVRCKNADLQRRLAKANAVDTSDSIVDVEAMAHSLNDEANSGTNNTPIFAPKPCSSSRQSEIEDQVVDDFADKHDCRKEGGLGLRYPHCRGTLVLVSGGQLSEVRLTWRLIPFIHSFIHSYAFSKDCLFLKL